MAIREPLLAGNWKMHGTRASARALAQAVAQAAQPGVTLAVFPPFVHLADVCEILKGSGVELGAQDCSWEREGAFTGEISAGQLADLGCRRVLVGHSERRHGRGETDAQVARKLRAALSAGLEPLLCVGETLPQREGDLTGVVLKAQVTQALGGLDPSELARVTLAYEPVWAIGTGRVASPQQARQAHALIREAAGAPPAISLRILYGGSVKPENLAALLAEPGVDGALVGGASLDLKGFAAMASTASSQTRKENAR